MKRIMLVTNSLTGGGAERSMNLIGNELTDRGWVISLVPINSGPPDQVTPRCEVFPIERNWKGNLGNTLLALWRFKRVVVSWKPDVLVLNCDLPELFGSVITGKSRLVVVEHSSTPWGQRLLLGKVVRKILAVRKAVWVSVASHLTIWPSAAIPRAILQNPVAPSNPTPPTSSGSDIERLVFIGRLSVEKRPDIALELSKRTGIGLEMIGDGVLREVLELKSVHESTKVRFRGQLREPWAETLPGDLLIVPSAFEGDGLVIIEGLQQDMPMLLADIPDLRRFGFPENNYCKDLDAFESRIQQFGHNLQELKVPSQNAAPILRSRSLSILGDSWDNFLKSL